MHRPSSKQRQLLLRIASYTFMTASVVGLVIVTVLLMLGYRINRNSNTLQQGGLVQFASKPSGAKITIGTANLANNTPTKITVNPGIYRATMQKDGYNMWEKSVDVVAGRVLWLNYAQLVPTTIETNTVSKLSPISSVLDSPDGSRMAHFATSDPEILNVTNLRSSNFRTDTITLPSTLFGKNSQPLRLVSWSDDNNKLLATRKSGSHKVWILLDTDSPNQSINLSKTFDVNIKKAVFDPTTSDQVIIQTTDGDLRRVDLSSNSLSVVLAQDVQSFSLYGEQAILYIHKPKLVQKIGYVSFGKTVGRDLPLRGIGATLLAGAQYFKDDYVAVATKSQVKIFQLDDLPASDSSASITATRVGDFGLASNPRALMFGPNERFVVAESSQTFHTYDIELDRYTSTDFVASPSQTLRWLDQYHVYYIAKNKLFVSEFDGANSYSIPKVANAYAVLTTDGKFIYSLQSGKQLSNLQRSRMILP